MTHEVFKKIHRFESVASTNHTLKEFCQKGAKLGTVVLAAAQTAGRGRGDHLWSSPVGGVYLSVLLAPREPKHITDLSILAGVAMAQAVREVLPKAVDVGLKWPNDCLLNGKKVGGILCEAVPEDPTGLCVVGMGVNVNLSSAQLQPFLNNPFSATSFLMDCPGNDFQVERVAETVLRKLENIYLSYLQNGFQSIQNLWERNCTLVGKKVEMTLSDKPGSSQKVSGVFLGLDEQGALILAVGPQGERQRFVSGELSCYWR
jgi:BirA family biotin operon repressor/biotin-[acetyl-CoA-carboxylase] ligase